MTQARTALFACSRREGNQQGGGRTDRGLRGRSDETLMRWRRQRRMTDKAAGCCGSEGQRLKDTSTCLGIGEVRPPKGN